MAPPDGSSIVVSARRTLSAGTVIEGPGTTAPEALVEVPDDSENEPRFDSSETSVETLSEMRPAESTTGVKPRPTP